MEHYGRDHLDLVFHCDISNVPWHGTKGGTGRKKHELVGCSGETPVIPLKYGLSEYGSLWFASTILWVGMSACGAILDMHTLLAAYRYGSRQRSLPVILIADAAAVLPLVFSTFYFIRACFELT